MRDHQRTSFLVGVVAAAPVLADRRTDDAALPGAVDPGDDGDARPATAVRAPLWPRAARCRSHALRRRRGDRFAAATAARPISPGVASTARAVPSRTFAVCINA